MQIVHLGAEYMQL